MTYLPALLLALAIVQHHGAAVMGFDQDATTHHFALYTDGGAIAVSVKDARDRASLGAIRSHLPHIRQMFSDGNFAAPMLVHDSIRVPGTAAMAQLRDRLTYKYVETPQGGRVDIVTADREALAAVHAFLTFQIADHQTGDATEVGKRP